ncbi:MAG: GH3 auxin-responsive promoter family protein [Rhodospirillales bacterium]|nr:GH3 auxin-responsive promoter family protein [Rhodospirillales bacterium]
MSTPAFSSSPTSAPPARAKPVPFAATPLLRAYAWNRWRALAGQDAVEAQRRELLKLVRAAEATKFGRDHGFANIQSVAHYQVQVPLRTYAQHWDEYWKDAFPRMVDCTWPGTMPYYAVSSGTSTGKVKYIPCSQAMVASNKKAALDIFVHHLRNRPHSHVFDGKSFVLGGSTDLKEQAPGVFSGDVSGIAAKNVPWWIRSWYFPPKSLTFLTDWEEKINKLAPQALTEDIRFISGAPGWLTLLFEKLVSLKPRSGGRIAEIFPQLELITHGGVSLNPYRKRFEAMLEGSRAELREVYPASEGFVAVADRGPQEGLRLIADNGLFYEFVPTAEVGSANPTRHWLGTVETGIDYAIVLTTCAGLWSYLIGDVVRFVDRAPPRLMITGRTAYMLSAFGEHVSGELIETCVLAAADEIGAAVNEFSVGTAFSDAAANGQSELGHHVYVVEFEPAINEPDRLMAFTRALDKDLARRNEDYDERRVIAGGVGAPVVHAVAPGTFAAWMKSRGRLGGQNKIPRVIPDPALLDNLLDFIRRP